MNVFQEATQKFLEREDYQLLAKAIYEASRVYYPKSYRLDFERDYVQKGRIPYSWEIQYVLNHPEATFESIWAAYLAATEGYAQRYTKEVYQIDPEGWQILIALTNGLRHTIKPSY